MLITRYDTFIYSMDASAYLDNKAAFKDRQLRFEVDLIKTALSLAMLLGFRHIIHQIKAYNFLYHLLYLKY